MNKTAITQLIYRDFHTYKSNILNLSLFVLAMSMFITFVNTNTHRIFSSGIGNIIIIVIGVFATEQSNSIVRMHTASLPVTRKEIVLARFLSSFIIVLVNTVLHFVVFNAITTIVHDEPAYTNTSLLIFALVFGVFQLSIYCFVFYRLNMVTSVIVFMGISILIYIMPAMLWPSISPGFGLFNDYLPQNPVSLFMFSLVTIGLLIISFRSSIEYYEKKGL